jgi:lysozyme family protein
MPVFDACFDIIVGTEAGLSLVRGDPGNWTGKSVGVGVLRGTKYGISAAAYPNTDISALHVDDARIIYRRDYWNKIGGDRLPGPLGLIMLDSAINSGPGRAEIWLQTALGIKADGVIGPVTLAALDAHAGRGADLFSEVLALRIVFDASLPTWPLNALGWSRRLARLPFQSLTVGA